MKTLLKLIASSALAVTLLLSAGTLGAQPKDTSKKTTTAKTATTAPTDQEIADAKAKGLVWVNTSTKVYHKEGQFYGKTKQGKFMTEDEAIKAGYKAAKEPAASKKTSSDTSKKK